MAFVKVSTEKVAKDVGGGNYLASAGIFPVTIKSASTATSKGGFVTMNFNFDYNGNEKVIYGLGLFNKDGSENFGMATLQSLMTILGIEELEDPETREIKTKDGTTDIEAFEQLDEAEVYVQITEKYSRYEGKVQRRLEVKRFFRADDFATGAEIINETPPGEQYEKLLPFCEKPVYKDGVTEAEALAAAASGTSGAGATTAAAKPKKSPFAKK